MTARRMPSDYYTSEEYLYENNNHKRISPRKNHSHTVSNNDGVVTSKRRNGTYNIVEKDFGEHKVIYHIPIEYGDDFDVSQLEDIPIYDEQPIQTKKSPQLVRRRIIQEYNDYDNDFEYVEEVPISTSRKHTYLSPKRQDQTEIVERIYESRPPRKRVEYVYEDDPSDRYGYRTEYDDDDNQEEIVEYVVRERKPKPTYMEEPRPIRRKIYVEDSPAPVSTSSSSPPPPPHHHHPPPPPPPPPAPVSYSPRRSPYQPSPRPLMNQKSPSPIMPTSNRRSDFSPPASTRKPQTNRSSPPYEPPIKPNIPKTNEPPLRLMDVIAQNRARRGGRIPKPRREVDEEKPYDPPTYNRNIIKNGFIVHK